MGHYDDQYEERDKQENERKKLVERAKRDLMSESTNQMIKILFKAHIDSLSDQQVIDLNNSINRRGYTPL